MLEHIKMVKDRVEYILQNYPETRDCDKLLWLGYLGVFHNIKKEMGHESYMKFKEIIMNKNSPPMESVRRVRQKFQEDGKYVGTKRNEKLRESERVKQWAIHG